MNESIFQPIVGGRTIKWKRLWSADGYEIRLEMHYVHCTKWIGHNCIRLHVRRWWDGIKHRRISNFRQCVTFAHTHTATSTSKQYSLLLEWRWLCVLFSTHNNIRTTSEIDICCNKRQTILQSLKLRWTRKADALALTSLFALLCVLAK